MSWGPSPTLGELGHGHLMQAAKRPEHIKKLKVGYRGRWPFQGMFYEFCLCVVAQGDIIFKWDPPQIEKKGSVCEAWSL